MTPVEKAIESKTFCIYPWIHQYVDPTGDVKPCCLYNPNKEGIGNLKDNSLKEIWNGDITKQMRLDMLNNVTIEGCSKCNIREGVSTVHRDEANQVWHNQIQKVVEQTNDDGSLPIHQLKYIDARFNNLCNFKCRTCSPRFSTSWNDDYQTIRNFKTHNEFPKTLLYPGNTKEHLLEEIIDHLPYVERIYFAGGEPMMQVEHYVILENLINLKNTGVINNLPVVVYSTNFSSLQLGNRSAIDLWKQFPSVVLNLSLDGSYERAEYWRKGTVWNDIVDNLKTVKNAAPAAQIRINYTLSWVNAFNLIDLHKEWIMLGYVNPNSINVNCLDDPDMYSLKGIPTWKKKQIEQKFLEHIEWLRDIKSHSTKYRKVYNRTINQFTDAISFMNSFDSGNDFIYKQSFNEINNKLDLMRDEDFLKVFSEHTDMIEFIQER